LACGEFGFVFICFCSAWYVLAIFSLAILQLSNNIFTCLYVSISAVSFFSSLSNTTRVPSSFLRFNLFFFVNFFNASNASDASTSCVNNSDFVFSEK